MSYSNTDFLKAFADKRGYTIAKAEKAMILLLPFVMMDVAYECYRKDIMPLELHNKSKQYRKNWSESYTKFNRHFLDTLDPDMTDAFCDKMDSFRRYMYLDILQLQAKMFRCLPDGLNKDIKQVVASAMLCNRISRIAADIWSACYKVNGDIPSQNNGLNGCLTWSRAFAKEYTKSVAETFNAGISVGVEQELYKGIDSFRQKCFDFVQYDMNVA